MNAPFPARHFDATAAATLRLFAFFHLNLAFSSIEEAQRGEVIAHCYWPLLRLAENRPIGIEASGFTLEEIEKRDPQWIAALKRLIGEGRVEFIGAGYSQMIGPLVPWRVTAANLALGNEIYHRLLGVQPTLALVNEQAYSCGLVGLYLDAGYKALLMDWDNPCPPSSWPAETALSPAARHRQLTGAPLHCSGPTPSRSRSCSATSMATSGLRIIWITSAPKAAPASARFVSMPATRRSSISVPAATRPKKR